MLKRMIRTNPEKLMTNSLKKFKSYCEKVPATLNHPFSSLLKQQLDISTSSDGQLKTIN